MKTIAVRMKIVAERHQELIQAVLSSIASAREEAGCRRCSFMQSVEDDKEFMLLQEWDDHEQLESYVDSILIDFLHGVSHLLIEPFEMNLMPVFPSRKNIAGDGAAVNHDSHDEIERRALEHD